ncbi:MAG: UpxY family transcription antiterminator [Prevotella sp.]|nr:UpxY family transcription antiterminator [Prevotella sp.]
MQQLDKEKAYWFVLGTTTVNREIKIYDAMKLQHIECFVPLKYQVKRVRNRQQETLVPAIAGLIFAHGTEEKLKDYMLSSKDRLFFRHSAYSNHQDRLIVSDRDMRQFMDFVAAHQQVVNYFSPEEIAWREGELVRVTIGTKEYEGKIVRIKGKRKKVFALEIKNTTFATIELTPELMQSIQTEEQGKRQNNRITKKQDDRDDYRSKDVEADKKLLFEKAFRLLFVLSDQQISMIREYQVTQKEMERAMKRLARYKGFTAATEGELALPLFMGAMVTGENTEAATERLKKAMERLKDSSMLKFRMRFYLAKLTDDQEELERITQSIQDWKKQGLQSKQRAFLEEVKGVL